MKKVLIITYYWPPSGGAGVQRWLKFAKYLRNFGWEPVIYTPENPETPAIDNSLEKDIPEGITVLKTRVWEPYTFYKRFVGRKKGDNIKAGFLSEKKNPSITEKVSVWIRGNLFIPDARKFWIKPSVKYLINYLKDNSVDAMVSTGPPHSMHMIALGLKQKLNIPWLADFRDPWTNIDFYDKLMLTSWADRKHRLMEKSVLDKANIITTVSWNWAEDFRRLGAIDVEVFTNGFDPDDFLDNSTEASDLFHIVHIGSMNKDRNPNVFWESINDMIHEDQVFGEKLKISFIGQTDYSVLESLERNNLSKWVEQIEYKPHDELMKFAKTASVLLLPLNNTPNVNGIIPGKLFEYLALNIPILCIGPKDGDSARIIKECRAGSIADFNDKSKMKSSLLDYYSDFNGEKMNTFDIGINRMKYSRRKLTGDISELLDKLIKSKN